jgi:hypothetical protein
MVVTGMSEEEISDIVSEPPGIARKREYLEARKISLEKGRSTFKLIHHAQLLIPKSSARTD